MKSNKTISKSGSSKTTKRSSSSRGAAETLDVNKNTSANIRQIENGYLISESGYTGKGKNQQYFTREYFSKTNPVAGVKISFSGKK